MLLGIVIRIHNNSTGDSIHLAKEVDHSRSRCFLVGVQQEEGELAVAIQWQAAIITPHFLFLCLCA